MKRNAADPDPVGTTPKQIADELDRIGRKLLGLSYDCKRLGVAGHSALRAASDSLCDVARMAREPEPAVVSPEPAKDPNAYRIVSQACEMTGPMYFSAVPVPDVEPEPDPPRNGLVELAAEPADELTDEEREAAIDELTEELEALDERKARKREADRKYAARRKAARDLARAIGNPVESSGAPAGTIAREPVIAGPTEPAKSLADWQSKPTSELGLSFAAGRVVMTMRSIRTAGELADWLRMGPTYDGGDPTVANSWTAMLAECRATVHFLQTGHLPLTSMCDLHPPPKPERSKSEPEPATAEIFNRKWEAYDVRESPPVRLGEVTGANSTRAVMAAEAAWPDVPKRMLEIREVVRSNGRRKRSEAVS